MGREPVFLEVKTAAGSRLRVTFRWNSDRYDHRIELVESSDSRVLVESVEEMHDDGWPLSPPLQQLHIEDRPDGRRVALLVGMACRSHWSASIEMDADGRAILFDIACRYGDQVGPLRSTYRAIAEDPSCWTLVTLSAGDDPSAQLLRDSDQLVIAPSDSSSRTVRWKYRIALA